MPEHEFSLTRIFPNNARINDSALMRKNAGQKKIRILTYIRQALSYSQENHLKGERFIQYRISTEAAISFNMEIYLHGFN